MKRIPEDSIVRLIDLPPGIGGAVMEDEDGFISIYVNARHGHYAQLDDLEHEIAHIENDDLHSEESVSAIEARANGISNARATIPKLMKARDLIPKQTKQAPVQPLTPHQARTLYQCIKTMDDWLFTGINL